MDLMVIGIVHRSVVVGGSGAEGVLIWVDHLGIRRGAAQTREIAFPIVVGYGVDGHDGREDEQQPTDRKTQISNGFDWVGNKRHIPNKHSQCHDCFALATAISTFPGTVPTGNCSKGTQPQNHKDGINGGQPVRVCESAGAREAWGHGLVDEGWEREKALRIRVLAKDEVLEFVWRGGRLQMYR